MRDDQSLDSQSHYVPVTKRTKRYSTNGRLKFCGPWAQAAPWRWIAAFCLGVLALTSPVIGNADGPITYAYDVLGRLVAVVDTSITSGTNAGAYKYDAVGNLTAITNNSATTVAIFSFLPNNGPTTTTVTIYGDGFSTTPSSNTVKFNGTAATVTASTLATITVTVPANATTGTITVSNTNGTATSSTNFTVTAN
jgi:YD repeat-containing protein